LLILFLYGRSLLQTSMGLSLPSPNGSVPHPLDMELYTKTDRETAEAGDT